MILPYLTHILILIGIYTILIVSLNLALGYSGLLNLGHVALWGIGAYTSALLTIHGVPFIFSFIIAGIVTALFGLLLVFATRRLKGDYFALASLGFSFVVYSLLLNLTELTRGPLGVAGIPKPSLFRLIIKSNNYYLIFVAIISFASIFLINKIVESGFGKLLEAMRDDEIGLRVLGKDTTKLKYKVMLVSGFFTGISGSLFAHYIGFIDPNTFYISELILLITIVIIGGIASIKGSIIATFIILSLSELIRFLPVPSSIVGPIRQITYVIVLLLILMFKPRGLFGRVDLE